MKGSSICLAHIHSCSLWGTSQFEFLWQGRGHTDRLTNCLTIVTQRLPWPASVLLWRSCPDLRSEVFDNYNNIMDFSGRCSARPFLPSDLELELFL
ncbi:unnamed protein product, partial [Nesidiocoris tenuis]